MKHPGYDLNSHYNIERELAERIRCSSQSSRRTLYGVVYDELFRRVPGHPQLARKHDHSASDERSFLQLLLIRRFLKPSTRFYEIGAGDCSLSLKVSKFVTFCYCLDVSTEIFANVTAAPNMAFILSDGCSIPRRELVSVVYSNQVMEHLHPEDALTQLTNIYATLAPGGKYICITPNRLNGPHDVSKFFDKVSTGFHLREYTLGELQELFERVGFRNLKAYVGLHNTYFSVPITLLRALEAALSVLPDRVISRVANARFIRNLLFISLAGQKLSDD